MVNKRVYNYLIKNSKQHSLVELSKRLVDSGYDKNVVNEAINVMKQQTSTKNVAGKNLPVKKIVKKSTPVVAKTKTQIAPQKQVKQSNQTKPTKGKEVVEPKRSRKGLWIFLMILLLLLIAAVVYYFFFR